MHLLTKINYFSNSMCAEMAAALLSATPWKTQCFVRYVKAQDIINVLVKVVRIKNMGFVIMLAELVSMYFITGLYYFIILYYKLCEVYKCTMCRPVSVLLQQLMRYPKFRESSNYYDKMPYIEDNFGDALNGNTAVSALQEMNANFEARTERGELVDYVNSSHLYSEFYDGAQLFDKRISNFHALMISILNLPPLYQTKMGCGAFVIVVHTLKESSRAERTLTLRLFVEELRLLHAGIK